MSTAGARRHRSTIALGSVRRRGCNLLLRCANDSAYRAPKNACEQGECAPDTVLLDGLPCFLPRRGRPGEGRRVVTVEGLATDDRLHPAQEAFIEAGAVNVDSVRRLVDDGGGPGRTQPGRFGFRGARGLAGNCAGCTGYEKILEAVRLTVAKVTSERTFVI